MHRLLNAILVAAILVVAFRVFATWTADDPVIEDGARGRPRPAADLPSATRAPAVARLAMTIAERDLFDESRRAPSAATVDSAPLPPPNVELVGVIMVGPEPEALVKDSAGTAKARHVVKGDDVSGYTVSAISATEVILTSPSGEEVPLPLKLKLSPAQPAAGGRAARAAANAQAQGAGGQPTAAGPAPAAQPRPAAVNSPADPAARVRERLRELRRKRREQQMGPGAAAENPD
jgi:hypothetical protein